MDRFLAIFPNGTPDAKAWSDRIIRHAETALGFKVAFTAADAVIVTTPSTPTLAIGRHEGILVGPAFLHQDEAVALTKLPGALADEIAKSKGRSLVDQLWGGFAAFLLDRDKGGFHVIRDPSGAMPVYRITVDAGEMFFSDVELASDLNIRAPELDWQATAHHLAFPGLRVVKTCLASVTEVLPGSRLSIMRDKPESQEPLWIPWSFTDPSQQYSEQRQAIEDLARDVRRCVGGWASLSSSLLLELSGGTDSSIIAMCLADQSSKVTCVTLVTPDPGGDERRYARLVASQIGAPLREVDLCNVDTDLRRPQAMRSSRPNVALLHQVADRAFAAEGVDANVDAFFSGGGGDNVFCFISTAAPAADAFRAFGPGRRFIGAIGDLAQMHQCTAWTVATLAIRKLMRPKPHAWPRRDLFLRADALPTSADAHPWMTPPAGTPPGKREHVLSLTNTQNVNEGKDRARHGAVRYPLLSQPIVETCLRIPTWMWIAGGRNRSVAREAFAGSLPKAIVHRRTKGDFTAFIGSMYRRRLDVIRELLLDGELARNGLLDRQAVEENLKDDVTLPASSFSTLLKLGSVEVWARSWTR